MLSTKEIRDKSRRKRNLEGMVRLTHETMVAGAPIVGGKFSDNLAPSPSGWEEMVFENRNKDYGAYALRKGYTDNVTIGLVITVVLVALIILYPTLSKFFGSEETVDKTPARKLVYTELSAPPPIDKHRQIPPNVQLPRLQKVVKFVPPKVVKEEVTEPPPTIVEIKASETGSEEVAGPALVVFDEPVETVVMEEEEIFIAVDQQPEFAGGYEAMMRFIKQNMQYPPNARRMKIEGTVHVSFVVSKTGSISDVKVLRGIMTECDREAVRVVQMMPTWNPGKQNGRNVSVRFIMPLKFRLN